MNHEIPQSCTVRDFCRRHQVSVATVYRMFDRGELDRLKIGRLTRIPRNSEQAWLERGGSAR